MVETKVFPKIPKEDQVSNPMERVLYHITLNFVKMGAFLGTVASLPLKKKFPVHKTALFGAGTGLLLGIVTCVQKKNEMSEDGVIDRAFRIHHNSIVQNSDKTFYAGALLGGVFGILKKKPVLGSTALFSSIGFAHMLGATVYSKMK